VRRYGRELRGAEVKLRGAAKELKFKESSKIIFPMEELNLFSRANNNR